MNREAGAAPSGPGFLFTCPKIAAAPHGRGHVLYDDGCTVFADIWPASAVAGNGSAHGQSNRSSARSQTAILGETLNRSIAQGGAHKPGDVRRWLSAIVQDGAKRQLTAQAQPSKRHRPAISGPMPDVSLRSVRGCGRWQSRKVDRHVSAAPWRQCPLSPPWLSNSMHGPAPLRPLPDA